MKKIMIVEDEAVIALRLEQRLAEMGYEVIGMSYTGEDSVKKARSLLPDLILMDVMLSGDLSGIDAAKIMKEDLDIPVIFMTAYTEDQIIERAKEVEPYGYIIKPIRERELKATIEIALFKKTMEKRLQESEEKYRQLFETLSDAIIIFDGETRKIIDINDTCLNMYGYSKDEFLKLRLHDITAEPEKSEKAIKHAMLGETQKIPLRYHKRNDGTRFPVEINSGTFSLEDRIVVCGVIRDISKRKQAEKALSKSEERYRAVVESQNEMICRFVPDGTLTFVNDAYCRYFGKKPEELIGHKFMPLIPDSDRDKMFKSIALLNPNTPVITHEHRVLAPDGKISWHKWTNRAIFDDKSALVEYQAIGWDITDRVQAEKALQESEENFRALAENANDGILIAIGEGEHAYVNKRAAEITGYSVSELFKTTIKDLAHPDEFKKIKERFKTILGGKPFQRHYETKIIRKDGKELPIEVASAVSIWQGQPADIVIIRDISQRNRAEEALRDSKE